MTDAKRQTALVTGASAGIGMALARVLAAGGHDLVVTARRAERLEALARELRERHGGTVHVWPEDLIDPAAPQRLFERARDAGIAVDVLVNNAGFGAWGEFDELPHQRQLEMIAVNVRAVTDLTHRFLPAMRERRAGRILIVSSVCGFQPGPYMAAYFATKAFLLFLGEALSAELAGSGVTTTCLCPGLVRTEFHKVAGMEHSRVMRFRSKSAEEVAEAAYRGMMRGKRVVVPGLGNKFSTMVVGAFPSRFVLGMVKRLQAPDAQA